MYSKQYNLHTPNFGRELEQVLKFDHAPYAKDLLHTIYDSAEIKTQLKLGAIWQNCLWPKVCCFTKPWLSLIQPTISSLILDVYCFEFFTSSKTVIPYANFDTLKKCYRKKAKTKRYINKTYPIENQMRLKLRSFSKLIRHFCLYLDHVLNRENTTVVIN